MNWINLNIQTLDSENFLGSEPVDRATWLCLLRYCIGQENGGIITDCLDWGDRKWQQLVRVTKKEATRQCDLWSWDGKTLIVWGYPVEKEDEIQQKRERAKTNGALGGRPRKAKVETEIGTDKKPTLVISAKAEGERKGKEVEERECAGEKARQIVDAYPRREKVAECLSIVSKHLDEGEDFEAMLSGTKACAAVIRTLPSAHLNRYVPSAGAFFLGKRWKDDPETMKRQGNQASGQGQMDLEDAKKLLGRRAKYLHD